LKSKMLPRSWNEPTMMATMLAASNADLTRPATLLRMGGVTWSGALRISEREIAPPFSWPAAWAARRAAAMKLALLAEAPAVGRAPPSAASEAAIRNVGGTGRRGGADPGARGLAD